MPGCASSPISTSPMSPWISTPTGPGSSTRSPRENVKKRLAIVLDNNVYSAPVIQERISGGKAQISGSFTPEEASDLAIVLRAGALPAPVKIIQNVTVGPSLGQDSIDKGIRAALIGSILVVLFMAVYYGLSGLIADWALVLNIIYLLGALASMRATLTLPGIAGIILAIGMAVDSNVLMFERIREELRLGKTVRAAVDAGYDKALFTIIDSHVTTLITAVVLFQFGTGPDQGLCRHPQPGRDHQPLFGPDRDQGDLRLDQPEEAAQDPEHLRKGRNPYMGIELLGKTNINFIGLRKYAFILSAILVTLGIIALVQTGARPGQPGDRLRRRDRRSSSNSKSPSSWIKPATPWM